MNIKTISEKYRQSSRTAGAKPFNLLVIDDDITASFIIFEAFSKVMGHNVYCSNNGKDGIEMFKNNKFDLIITDIHMPEMDGYETARQIRKIDKKIPIIALTGSPDADLSEKVKKSHINAFVLKPYNFFSLALSIYSMIENSAGI